MKIVRCTLVTRRVVEIRFLRYRLNRWMGLDLVVLDLCRVTERVTVFFYSTSILILNLLPFIHTLCGLIQWLLMYGQSRIVPTSRSSTLSIVA
jgi:hypothetical protein